MPKAYYSVTIALGQELYDAVMLELKDRNESLSNTLRSLIGDGLNARRIATAQPEWVNDAAICQKSTIVAPK